MSDFLNPSIQTKTEFKNWIMRQLGFPGMAKSGIGIKNL